MLCIWIWICSWMCIFHISITLLLYYCVCFTSRYNVLCYISYCVLCRVVSFYARGIACNFHGPSQYTVHLYILFLCLCEKNSVNVKWKTHSHFHIHVQSCSNHMHCRLQRCKSWIVNCEYVCSFSPGPFVILLNEKIGGFQFSRFGS